MRRGRGLGAEEARAHVVLEADDGVAALGEVEDGLGADQAARSGDYGDGHGAVHHSLGFVAPRAPAILVENVSKSFRHPTERVHTLKERALHPLRRSEHRTFEALRDVGFEVGKGEFFGIVGRNGSGKSTLLKCLAGIYAADTGRMLVDGRCRPSSSSASASTRTSRRATTRCSTRSCSASTARGARAHRPHHRVRRARGVRGAQAQELLVGDARAARVLGDDPGRRRLLLIDEVLAVGDAEFQQKCYDEFNRLRDEGRTVLLVTHDMPAVQRFCDRAMLLERGRVVMLDEAERVATRYFDVNFNTPRRASRRRRPPTTSATATAARRSSTRGSRTRRARSSRRGAGQRVHVLRARALQEDARDPHLRRDFVTASTTSCSPRRASWHIDQTGWFRAGEETTLRIGFENWFAPGRYWAASASRARAAATTCSTTASGSPR